MRIGRSSLRLAGFSDGVQDIFKLGRGLEPSQYIASFRLFTDLFKTDFLICLSGFQGIPAFLCDMFGAYSRVKDIWI